MSVAALDTSPAGCAAVAPVRLECLAGLVPAARPGERARLVLRRRGARPVARAATPTALIVARAGAPADGLEQRLAEWWDGVAPDEPLVVREGCEVVVGGRLCPEPARRALLAWLPPGRRELLSLEAGLLADAPIVALTLALRPPTIWSAAEAAAVPRGGERDLERLERHARTRVRSRHLLRLDAALDRLESHLPAAALPVASATLARGCAALRRDRARAADVVALQLVRYAWMVPGQDAHAASEPMPVPPPAELRRELDDLSRGDG